MKYLFGVTDSLTGGHGDNTIILNITVYDYKFYFKYFFFKTFEY